MIRPAHRARALLSVHDVMPETLDRVDGLLRLAERAKCPLPTLLVVPGRDWGPDSLEWLRRKASNGHPLAGHGWNHRAPEPRGTFHRLHALVISADQAEHLSRPAREIRRVVERCHDWFSEHGLPSPDTYVPPAWAIGALTPTDLKTLPFRRYETLTGFVDAASGRLVRTPLVGFEAFSLAVAWSIRVSNRVNRSLGRVLDRPVRVCMHPKDLELRMSGDLIATLEQPWLWMPDPEGLFD